jgi:hypothetical protein
MDNEPTLTIYKGGDKFWRLNGKVHRVDGPAIDAINGNKFWYLHDKCHREDGPAIEYSNGDKRWYLDNKLYTFDNWLEANTFISEEEKLMLKLIHG